MALRVSSIPALVELVEVLRRLRARPQNVDVPPFLEVVDRLLVGHVVRKKHVGV